ncbi:MAG TPA: hypothetical protein VLA77_04600 [Candidatus Saccharimonadales bacterium]|nr:hypothetical protein [Candidatus Saccharimonadales bacterium]
MEKSVNHSEQRTAKRELHLKAYRPTTNLIFDNFNNRPERSELFTNPPEDFISAYNTYEGILVNSIKDTFHTDNPVQQRSAQAVFNNHNFVSWRYNQDWPYENLPIKPTFEQTNSAFEAKMIRNKSIGLALTLLYMTSIKNALRPLELPALQTCRVICDAFEAIEPLAFLHDSDEADLLRELVNMTEAESLFPSPQTIKKIYNGEIALSPNCWDIDKNLKIKFNHELPAKHLMAHIEPRMGCPVAVGHMTHEGRDSKVEHGSYLQNMWCDVALLMLETNEFVPTN